MEEIEGLKRDAVEDDQPNRRRLLQTDGNKSSIQVNSKTSAKRGRSAKNEKNIETKCVSLLFCLMFFYLLIMLLRH